MTYFFETFSDFFKTFSEDIDYSNCGWSVAANAETHPKILEILTNHKDDCVRWYAAGNPNTPLSALEKLYEKGDNLNGIAHNTNIPLEFLEKLSHNKCPRVRGNVASNPSTPLKILEKLTEDKDSGVRWAARHNPKNPKYDPDVTITITKSQKEAIQKWIDSSQDESLKSIKL